MRLFMSVLLVLLALQQYSLWFGKNGIKENHRLAVQVNIALNKNKVLIERNQLMYAQIYNLKNRKGAIEENARNELGLIKKGETFFRIVPREENYE
ncbi:MAG: septum formation initiator family protein [Psychromonas sp.]|nr:septum formation initiator family protein [Psychromonas sp.]